MEKQSTLILHLETLTPIWTGSAETGEMERIQETNIIGSLRWWAEAIVRGFNAEVCPGGKCSINSNDSRPPEKQICPVCQVFGTTGWKRRFRLTVIEEALIDYKEEIVGWKATSKPQTGNFTVIIQSLFADFNPLIIAGLLQFVANCGVFGGKTSMGFGKMKIKEPYIDLHPLVTLLSSIKVNSYKRDKYPSIQKFFFAKIKISEKSNYYTLSIKKELTGIFSENSRVKCEVMGGRDGRNLYSSKIKISHIDSIGIIHVYGYLPASIDIYGITRYDKMKEIYDILSSKYHLVEWREYNSPRDNMTGESNDLFCYLKSFFV